eukprot:TRINITY_DN51548_c0_g1_i1.p2 TRINITY_DN51548_c0_g1~~TRINITY_DN51548_c0_g1_i1.p2  ORF type:complete len:101 (-),score=25.13 TRINITY_DN51548_c0_g1_i1:82-384(-)
MHKNLKEEQYAPNQYVFKQNQEAEKFYIVKSGQFKILKNQAFEETDIKKDECHNQNLKNSKKITIEAAILGPNEYFGEKELFTNQKRAFTVVSASSCGIV